MDEKTLKATHQGELKIADKNLSCAVLENGTRILNLTAVFTAFDRTPRSIVYKGNRAINVPSFIDANNLQVYINKDLQEAIKPIDYINLKDRHAKGYNAEILPLICDVYLEARNQGVLKKSQLPLAAAAEILVRSLSKVGIIALVDEATGYQEVRDRLALQEILEKFIAKELRPWVKTFPDEYYENLFRLRRWQYKPLSVKKPSYVGKLTNDIIYERLAPGVLDELKKIVPKNNKGKRKHQYHRRLTEDIGHPKLREHISNVIILMKASASWNNFYRLMQRALPKFGITYEIELNEEL